jgi:hypothetical protein
MKNLEINANDIFYNYDEVRDKVLDMITKEDNISLEKLMNEFLDFLFNNKPEHYDEEVRNMINFLIDVPFDIKYLFVLKVDGYPRVSDEFRYCVSFMIKMLKDKDFNEKVYQVILDFHEGIKRILQNDN